MPRQKRSTPKKRGRPVTTGKGTLVGIRCHKEFLGLVDAWRAGQEGELSRPAAIHRLAELWLDAGGRDTKRGFADPGQGAGAHSIYRFNQQRAPRVPTASV